MSGRVDAVTLEAVVRRAELVVLAAPSGSVLESVPIGPDPAAHPPFQHRVSRFVVEEVLHGGSRSRAPARGAVIEVERADLDYDLTVHKKRHLEGVNKITLHERYSPSKELDEAARRILFLVPSGARWAFAVDGAFESEGLRAKVVRLLRAGDGPERAPPVPGSGPVG